MVSCILQQLRLAWLPAAHFYLVRIAFFFYSSNKCNIETCCSCCFYINILSMCVIPFINIASLAVLIVITAVFPGCQNVIVAFHSDIYIYLVVCWVLLLVGFVCALVSLCLICCALMCGSILAITLLGSIAGDAVAKEVSQATNAYGKDTGQYQHMLSNEENHQ